MKKKKIAIIGGGAAGLAFASFIDTDKFAVTIYEKNKALGRKLLVAGKGGFNLTHSEEVGQMAKKYTPMGFLDPCLESFSNLDFRTWLSKIGIPTFVGSSKRVFPIKGIKPIQVLNAMLTYIRSRNVRIQSNYEWKGEDLGDIMVYSLGGGSWKVTGSDGAWVSFFEKTLPFSASNCAFEVNWSPSFIEVNEGKPLKNIILECDSVKSKGELMITKFGLEGGAIYALSKNIIGQLEVNESAYLDIDLKKDLKVEQIVAKLEASKESHVSKALKRDIKLDKTAIQLIKSQVDRDTYNSNHALARQIKKLSIRVLGIAPIDEAISTTGGIPIDALDDCFQLYSKPGHYCIGEMVDWNAPTGGYLLQACFSMGYYLATKLSANHL